MLGRGVFADIMAQSAGARHEDHARRAEPRHHLRVVAGAGGKPPARKAEPLRRRLDERHHLGWKSDRVELRTLVKSLQPGAVVVVTRLDRLARSTIDLLTTIKQIADKGCLFKSLAEPWADTTTPAGRLMLTVLGGLAEFERELIKIRTSEGRERAKRARREDGTQAAP